METNYEAIEKAQSAVARERLMKDLKALSHDAEDLLKATAGDVSDKVKQARDRLGAAVERAKATCQDWKENTVASVKAAAQKADTVVREHPYQSMGVAFGIGVLLGVLARRR